MIKGISVLNPDNVELDYYLRTVDYAIAHGYDHLQLIGPIHDYVRGNIDGMIFYKKYADFNAERDADYVNLCLDAVNVATKKAAEHGIKNYMWHHELYLPEGFKAAYPEILNAQGDIEVSHPLIRDFLHEKIVDFFEAYPYMDGVILTLHETSVPLLKLQNQKLGKVERVKYVTEVLYNACTALGKELIVRPFASLEEDYEMMTAAYAEISPDLMIMDKWTQFDWSLAMPSNPFFHKIKKNPLFVEGDIFGEYFGKGRLPLMLMKHLQDKFAYCEKFKTAGYVLRIDRNGQHPFDSVNEVNLEIAEALLNGTCPKEAALRFFERTYPGAGKEVMDLMASTEKVITDMFYINAFLFSQLSTFQDINHSKNHFYFEMMRKNPCIASDEWFIPKPWQVPAPEEMRSVKKAAAQTAQMLFEKLLTLKDKIAAEKFDALRVKFSNLNYAAQMWYLVLQAYMAYAGGLENRVEEAQLDSVLERMIALDKQGKEELGDLFYCGINSWTDTKEDRVGALVHDIRESYALEKAAMQALADTQGVVDYIVCGGGLEGHKLQKEVNFSDVLVYNGKLCRLPGNDGGVIKAAVNAHGWFSYEIKTVPGMKNTIRIAMENTEGVLSCSVRIGDAVHEVYQETDKETTLEFSCVPDTEALRIRIDRNSPYVPYVYSIVNCI